MRRITDLPAVPRERDEEFGKEPALRLPPSYRFTGAGGEPPSYFATTAEFVMLKMANNGRVQYNSKTRFFFCIYCQFDSTLRGFHVDRQWHPEHLTRIDHIFPFQALIQHVNSCYTDADYQQLISLDLVPETERTVRAGWNIADAALREILYNDVDNLHVICAGHKTDKNEQISYLGLLPRQIQQIYSAP